MKTADWLFFLMVGLLAGTLVSLATGKHEVAAWTASAFAALGFVRIIVGMMADTLVVVERCEAELRRIAAELQRLRVAREHALEHATESENP